MGRSVFVTLAVDKGLTMAGAPSAAAVGEAGVWKHIHSNYQKHVSTNKHPH